MIENPVIITKRNIDSQGNPISIYIIETKQIFAEESVIVLRQVPDEVCKVKIQGYKEVFDREKLKHNEFKVDYMQGVVYFHPKVIGKTVVIEYYGIGYELISCSRIFTKYDKYGNVLETLEELIGNATEQLELIKTLGDSVAIIDKLETSVQNGNSISNSISDKIVEVKNASDTCVNNVNTVIQKAKDEVINVSGNKEFLVLSSEWVLNGDVYEKQLTHTLNSENLHVTTKDRDTKDAVMIGYKILDKSNILLKSDEAINMSVVLSASYYHAVQTISDNVAEEVIRARKSESSLDNKIGKIDESIASINEDLDKKITQGVGAVMPEDLHTETKKLLTGDKVAVVDVNSVGRENIKNNAVNPDKTSFLKSDRINLFNYLTVVKGYIGEDGNIVSDENIVTSDYISIKPNTKYKVNTSNNIVCGYFDVNKTLISTFLDKNEIITPSNCKYIRYGILKEDLSIAMLVEGNTLPSNYISYYNYKIELEDNLINGVKKSILKNPIKSNETNFIVADRKNLFDKNNVFYGYVGLDGNIVYDLSVECSDYIEVKPNTKYSLTSNGNWLCGYYDNNKTFISNFSSTNEIYITTPSNCKYIRYTTPNKDTSMIVEGEVLPTSYIQFDDCNIRLKSKWNNKNMAMFGDSIVWYDGQISGQGLIKGYLSNMNDLIKFNSMLNYGHNGGCIAETLSDSFTDVVTVVTQTDFSNIHLAIIEGGTNDFYNNVPLGDIGSIYDSNFNINTFYGAYRKIIEHILSSNPKTQIVLFTPLQRDCQGYNIETVNTVGHKLIDYVNAIKKIGEMYSEPIFDQYNISGVNIKTLNTYTMDGLHLNNYGYEQIVKNKLVPFLENI